MHTLALVNQKGGCGKTTVAVNLAGALAARGERVLLVDLDPQAHATLALGCGVEDEPTVRDVLVRGVPIPEAIQEAPGGLTLLPATLELREFEEVAERTLHPERVLRNALHKVVHRFDFVVLDCPPRTDGVLAANALRAADTAVLVVETGSFALQGALRAVHVLEEVADGMEIAFELRVVATMFDRRTRLARELLIGIQSRFADLLYDSVVHQSVRLREAAASGVPVQVLDPDSRATRDFEALADEVRADAPRAAFVPQAASPFLSTRPAPHTPGAAEWETASDPEGTTIRR